MSNPNLKKIRQILISLSALIVVFMTGFQLGKSNISQSGSSLNLTLGADTGLSVDNLVNNRKKVDLQLYWKVWDKLKTDYIDHEELEDQNMVYQSIKGLVSATQDPYTVFLTPEENKRAKDDLRGAFEGVGIQLGYKEYLGENRLAVITAIEGNPAIQAGVKDGDFILEIDGESTAGMALPDAVELIRGEKGTDVNLTLMSEGDREVHEITITRGTIQVPSVELDWIPDPNASNNPPRQIAHLRVSRFGAQTTSEWNKKISEIRQKGNSVKGIILDLRGNPGGFFQGAIELGSDLVKSGVIVQQESANGDTEQFRASGSARLVNYPLVILVNQGSASSSEILAGSVRELRPDQVKLVGKNTFGKGSVQEAIDMEDNAGLHITTYRWLLPSGKNIDKDGIPVDVEVEQDLETETDEQLQAAIQEL